MFDELHANLIYDFIMTKSFIKKSYNGLQKGLSQNPGA